jgi:OOP family OmpA-OmpF porin
MQNRAQFRRQSINTLLLREEPNMKNLMLLGAVGLAILCLLCLWCRAPAIEDGVRGAALACAEDVGLDAGMMAVSGRDVTLTGSVTSEALSHHLIGCIAEFPGTRSIDNRLEFLAAGALGFLTHYGDITISGVVPSDELKAAIIDEATALWGAGNVTDKTDVDPGRTIGGWSDDDFATFLATLRHSRRDLNIELSDGRAIVAGTVLSELARVRVLGGAVALLPGFEVVDRLTVREPATLRESLQLQLDALLQGKTVEFEIDSANLTPNGRRVLDEVIVILRDNAVRIEISGHTDSTGPIDHNIELSQRRAEAVQRYFIAKGLDVNRFEALGYGPTRPIASNETAEGQQSNRRTEFHALEEN